MNSQTMTLEQIREQGLVVLRTHLGSSVWCDFSSNQKRDGAIIRQSGSNGWAIQTLKNWQKRSKRPTQTGKT